MHRTSEWQHDLSQQVCRRKEGNKWLLTWMEGTALSCSWEVVFLFITSMGVFICWRSWGFPTATYEGGGYFTWCEYRRLWNNFRWTRAVFWVWKKREKLFRSLHFTMQILIYFCSQNLLQSFLRLVDFCLTWIYRSFDCILTLAWMETLSVSPFFSLSSL